MKRISLVFCFLLASFAFAQNPISASAAKPEIKTPVISAELRAAFFKSLSQLKDAQSAVDQAQNALQAKQKALQDSVTAINGACGDKFTAQFNKDGDPECVVKPDPAAKK